MQVLITKKEKFQGKKNGVDYVKMSFIAPGGATGEIFTTEEKYESFQVDEVKFANKEEIGDFFKDKELVL